MRFLQIYKVLLETGKSLLSEYFPLCKTIALATSPLQDRPSQLRLNECS